MFKVLLAVLLLLIYGLSAQAQPNLYVSNNISSFRDWPIIECGNHVYFLSDKQDSLSNGLAVSSYYFSSVNKYTHQLTKSILLLRDTAFNIYEDYQPVNICYTLNPATKKFSFYSMTDVDSSLYEASQLLQYPKTVNFMQLDTNLDISIPNRPVLHFNKISRYAVTGIGYAQIISGNRTLLRYDVRDTNTRVPFSSSSYADKFLIFNDTGKLLADEFLGWEPVGNGSYFINHLSVTDISKNYDGTFAVTVNFNDSICRGQDLTLFILDSTLHLTDTFDYPNSVYGRSPADNRAYSLGSGYENIFFLPTGSLLRSAWGRYSDLTDHKLYDFYGLGKGDRSTGYRAVKAYFPPPSDTNDYSHSSKTFFSTLYNAYDNRIYTFTSTKSDDLSFTYCLNGQPNLGQLAAIDTNLAEKWVKYIRPRPGYCLRSSSVAPTDGRNGVLVSGWEVNLTDSYNQSLWRPFIYFVDSNTSLGIGNPGSPVMITGQFTLYPNPATAQLFIENVLGTGYSYSIINTVGQAVVSGKGRGEKTGVAVGDLPAGVYLVRIQDAGNKSFSLRFLKE